MVAKVTRHGGESLPHARLKEAAVRWMQACGSRDAEIEMFSVIPGLSDAYSATHNLIAECGNTAFGKLRNAVLHRSHPRFTLIPFQSFLSPNGEVRRLLAVDFVWDRRLTDDLRKIDFARAARAASALELDDEGSPTK